MNCLHSGYYTFCSQMIDFLRVFLNAAIFFLFQEILDQIAEIDLVVNFKCTEDSLLKKNLRAGNFSHHRDHLSMSNYPGCNLNLQSQDKQLDSSSADSGATWKEKFHLYSEEVSPFFFFLFSFLGIIIFAIKVYSQPQKILGLVIVYTNMV